MTSLDVIIKQMILSAFRSANMTSASKGHINHFIGIESQGGMDILGSEAEIEAAILEIVEGITESPEDADDLAQNLLDAESKTGKKKKGKFERTAVSKASQAVGVLNDPASIVAIGLRYMPHAALVAFAISLAPLVFEYLTKPGGDLDLRLKIYLQDEFNAFLTRQTQKDTEMGVRQVIIQSKRGFTAPNGVNNFNTLRGIREGGINKERLDRIKMVDHAKGLF